MFFRREMRVGSPIDKVSRVMLILQLCLVFTVLLGILGYPFIGELYEHKSRTLLYNEVMGNVSAFKGSGREMTGDFYKKLERNQMRFQSIPEALRMLFVQKYDALQEKANRSFWTKMWRAFEVSVFEVPFFKQCWVLLGIVIPICILLQIGGARQFVWILPMLAVAYATANFFYGTVVEQSADAKLFPSEEVIVRTYLKKPLGQSIQLQHEQLTRGWKIYLIEEWARQEPSNNAQKFELQAEQGEFAFNVARLTMQVLNEKKTTSPFTEKESLLWLALYCGWNICLAWVVNRKLRNQNEMLVTS